MTTSYCVIGCTRGTGLQIARQLAERGAPVLGVARDPAKARDLLPAAVEIRAGDVTDPGSLRAAQLGACRAIFFAVDITGGIGGRGLAHFLDDLLRVLLEIYHRVDKLFDCIRPDRWTISGLDGLDLNLIAHLGQ